MNGGDDDGDGLVDREDPGCIGPVDDSEADPATVPECANAVDDDEDGATDLEDVVCAYAGIPHESLTGFVRFEAGLVTLGATPNDPCALESESACEVTLPRAFEIMRAPVTRAEWEAHEAPIPNRRAADCADCPAETLTWFDALHYANALSEDQGLQACYTLHDCVGEPPHMHCDRVNFENGLNCTGFRLPTEAEWEMAARAGSAGARYAGRLDDCGEDTTQLNLLAWTQDNGVVDQPVGGRQPNAAGLYDLFRFGSRELVWDEFEVRAPEMVECLPLGISPSLSREAPFGDVVQKGITSPVRHARISFRGPVAVRTSARVRLVRTVPN